MQFQTHDNGGTAFWVTINKKDVDVYKCEYEDDEMFKGKLLRSFHAKKVLIGYSPKTNMTRFSGGYGKQFDGNSILLEMSQSKFVFIGESIFEFQLFPNDQALRFYSPVGNSDVPYPYLVSENYVYCLGLSPCAIARSELPQFTKSQELDFMEIRFAQKWKEHKLPKFKVLVKRQV